MNLQKRNPTTLAEKAVAEYLIRHPDFFSRHLDLLESITIPHPCGEAVSLIARQIALLRDTNRTLQQQLHQIVQIARENDALFYRIQQLILAVMDTTTLEGALANLEWALHEYFQADYVATRILSPRRERLENAMGALFLDPKLPESAHFQRLIHAKKPECGPLKQVQAGFLFGEDARHIHSCALIPLRHGGLNGLLALGSRSKNRYDPAVSHAFLAQMGEIVAARLAGLLRESHSADGA